MRNLRLQLKQWRNRLGDVEEEKEKTQKKPNTDACVNTARIRSR